MMRKQITYAGWSLLAVYAGVACVGEGLIGHTHPAFGQVAPTTKKVDPKQITALIQQGTDALTVGDYKAARDTFMDVIQVDPRNGRGLHGLAVAYLHLNDIPKAVATIDKAVVVPGALDHAMAVNACVIHLQTKSPMRAAKIAREYLTSNPTLVDEPVANVLAMSLDRADAQARKNPFYADSKLFYEKYVKRMETANPGFLRWGIQWLPATEVQEFNRANAVTQPRVEMTRKYLLDAEQRLEASRKQLAIYQAEFDRGRMDVWTMERQRAETLQLEDTRIRRKTDYDEAVAALVRPNPLPETATVVALDAPVPPLTQPAPKPVPVAVASGSPDTPPTRPKPPGRNKPKPPKPATDTPPVGDGETATTEVVPPAPPVNPPVTPPRKVKLTTYAAAFPVAPDLLITAAAAVDGAGEITLQGRDGAALSATVVRTDAATGLALVRVKNTKLAHLDLGKPVAGKVVCAAFPEVNIFAPAGESLTATAPAPAANWPIRFTRHPRLAGAPLLQDGRVVGVVTGTRDNDLTAFPAVSVDAIRALLGTDAPKAASQDPDPLLVLFHLSAVKERGE